MAGGALDLLSQPRTMEGRKDMVMFLEGGQLGTLVGKRVPGLAEAVGSPAPDSQDKMMHRSCLSPRAGPPLAARERAAGEDEEVEVLPGAGTGPEGRSAAAALLSTGQPAAPEPLAAKGQQSSSDTESDFYEEIEVSCTPDCAARSAAEYQHSKGTARRARRRGRGVRAPFGPATGGAPAPRAGAQEDLAIAAPCAQGTRAGHSSLRLVSPCSLPPAPPPGGIVWCVARRPGLAWPRSNGPSGGWGAAPGPVRTGVAKGRIALSLPWLGGASSEMVPMA